MARGVGQSLMMSVFSSAAGVYILHMGVVMMTEKQIMSLGDTTEQSQTVGYGAVIAGLGMGLLAVTGKLLAMAITDAFFYPVMDPEQVWEDAPLALKQRLHFAVSKGYSRVALKGDAFHQMMKMPRQRHLRFVGAKGAVVIISRAMVNFISSLPAEEVEQFEILRAEPQSALPESFWTPAPVRPMPAQNY